LESTVSNIHSTLSTTITTVKGGKQTLVIDQLK
jgi:hypothetical protein